MQTVQLVGMLRENRARVDRVLTIIPEERMLQPMGEDARSGKDIVAHITAWEGRLIDWLEAARRGEPPEIPEPGATWDDVDRLNERTFEENRDRPLGDVLSDSRHSFARLIATVEGFSDVELSDPDAFPGFDVRPLWRRIAAGPGYGHYQAHLYDLLTRVDPADRFTPEAAALERYAGVYSDGVERITIRVEGDQLLVSSVVGGVSERPTLALDATHFAYENGGMVTFFVEPNGAVSGLECWSYRLPRVKTAPPAAPAQSEPTEI
jgi:hypothetical protein